MPTGKAEETRRRSEIIQGHIAPGKIINSIRLKYSTKKLTNV